MTQLGLDGRETAHPMPKPRPLSERQRDVLRYMRRHELVRPRDVGLVMSAGRERWASNDGYSALKRLERRGLVEHVERGKWRARSFAETGWVA